MATTRARNRKTPDECLKAKGAFMATLRCHESAFLVTINLRIIFPFFDKMYAVNTQKLSFQMSLHFWFIKIPQTAIKFKNILNYKSLNTYKKNCETFCHTSTLLIHNLKYLSLVSHCFTKGKNKGRV